MILVTVGMQLPFDRLIQAMDEIASQLNESVVGQTGASTYRPRNLKGMPLLAPDEFEELFGQARVIVAHAGIGTLLNAQRLLKPIILVPRRVKFGEHRNDHQLATCAQLAGRRGIHVAWDTSELAPLLSAADLERPDASDAAPGRKELIEGLRQYLAGVKV